MSNHITVTMIVICRPRLGEAELGNRPIGQRPSKAKVTKGKLVLGTAPELPWRKLTLESRIAASGPLNVVQRETGVKPLGKKNFKFSPVKCVQKTDCFMASGPLPVRIQWLPHLTLPGSRAYHKQRWRIKIIIITIKCAQRASGEIFFFMSNVRLCALVFSPLSTKRLFWGGGINSLLFFSLYYICSWQNFAAGNLPSVQYIHQPLTSLVVNMSEKSKENQPNAQYMHSTFAAQRGWCNYPSESNRSRPMQWGKNTELQFFYLCHIQQTVAIQAFFWLKEKELTCCRFLPLELKKISCTLVKQVSSPHDAIKILLEIRCKNTDWNERCSRNKRERR